MASGKKLYINGRFLTKKMTGTNRFAYEVCLALRGMGTSFTVLTPGQPRPEYDVRAFDIQRIQIFSSHLWEQITLPLFLLGRKSLLLNFSGLGPVFKKEQICTIYDLSFLENPEWFSPFYSWFYKIMTPIIAHRTRTILTISDFSRKEIIEKLRISPEKILVAYCGISQTFKTIPEESKGVEEKTAQPYILTVSSLDPRKNVAGVIKAFQLLDTKIPLYVIGEKNRVFRKLDLPESIANVHFLGRLSDTELRYYYKNASLFVYPSFYEGFGLPPLEAMACGCSNILVSDIPVFHELYGKAVSYACPYSVKDLARQMEWALKKKRLPICVSDLEKRFCWEKAAAKIIQAAGKSF